MSTPTDGTSSPGAEGPGLASLTPPPRTEPAGAEGPGLAALTPPPRTEPSGAEGPGLAALTPPPRTEPSGAEGPGLAALTPPPRTVVHLLRHGEVHNPTKVLYGRMPDFHLSALGREMADRAAEWFAPRDITAVVSSPLDRAQETAAPVAAVHQLDVALDPRLIEAANVFEGQRVGVGDGVLRSPSAWKHLYNPFRPSWGEPYVELAGRMRAAVAAARRIAEGHEAVCVSHQLPIWVARLDAENRRFTHDPRRRQCALASVTSFTFLGDRLVSVSYAEPAADLVARSTKGVGA